MIVVVQFVGVVFVEIDVMVWLAYEATFDGFVEFVFWESKKIYLFLCWTQTHAFSAAFFDVVEIYLTRFDEWLEVFLVLIIFWV
jgi:hypothetical protein